jgi:hypothetical protein
MRFNDSDINDPMHFWYRWSEWESYTTSKAWTFTSGVVGNKTVYVQFKDNMGNEGAGYSDTIILTRPFINYILGVKEPGLIVSIIGQNFGKTQVDSIVHIGPKAFDSSSPRIKLWSDAKIKIRLPNYQCGWFQGQDYRYIRVWVTIDGVDSNKRRIKIIKPDTCP